MGRKIVLNLCTLLVSSILSLVLLEVALRIYNPVVQTVKGDRVVLTANYDEVRKNAGIPGLAPESHIHQNSVGFRGADPPADFTDRLTLITVGGSTTRSPAQSDNVTWTALLGDAAADCFNHTWINNAGFDGHTSIAHSQLIRKYINKLHPKVVLMLVGANELFADGVLTQGRQKASSAGPDFDAAMQKNGAKGFLKDLLLRSEAVDLGLTLYRSFRARQSGFTGWTKMEGTVSMPPGGEAILTAATQTQSAYAERLRTLISLLQQGQTVPVLITQPTFGGMGRDPTTGNELSRLWFGLFWYRVFETYNDTMREVAESDHVELIDLARMMPKDTKYYIDPMHYSDAGAREVARQVSLALMPYLERKFPSFSRGTCQTGIAKPG